MKIRSTMTIISILMIGGMVFSINTNDGSVGFGAPLTLAAEQTYQGEGTVKEINKKDGRVKLAHGPIKSIGWGSMTMFFDVEEADLLDEIKPGDKVSFEFSKSKAGRFVVIDLEPLD
ncbi:Cu(I)/Ag(I) efflux system periplasmic protein CusF [Mariprofundus micogutta]|uniref:Cu(I)/Ag(I) efflux system periplasmic protein CusF n=1 Tax=Mariprofundus micogutta TaxID=1921010 RepID=A0A1L8CP26_9PROT|nr:copper-binding protein [Mariprofundus micogutta]GAV20671.1 Cu(I)/Ag(I) efflux system periplasmic protein CusF [Mariprofundus micogutta]